MSARTARWIAWSLVVVYIVLATAGLSLQFITNKSYTNLGIPVLMIMIILVGIWPIIGAMIVTRHPSHPVGWLLCFGLLAGPIDMFAYGYVSAATNTLSGSLPGVDLALVWLNWSGFPFAVIAFALVILLFPDGHLPSPRWRIVVWTAVAALLLHLALQASKPGPVDPLSGIVLPNPIGVNESLWTYMGLLSWIAFSILVLFYSAAFISLVFRLRRAQGEQRQQIKWLIIPAGLYWISIPFVALATSELNLILLGISIVLSLPAIAGMVIASAFAIFRYRLYDIDIIINRALVYGTLTAIVVVVYVLIVGGLATLLRAEGNLLISLLATGLIAVLFQPLRERLQRAVNHLTYGDRDEPFEALARLGGRLESNFSADMVYPTIVETVAHALKLPYVAISVKRGEGFETAGAYGDDNQEPVAYPLLHQGEMVGQLLVGRRSSGEKFNAADERLLRSFARQAGTAVHAVQLTADLQRSRQALVTAREEERLRLRRDLHDGLGPALASVIWQTDSARDIVYTDPQEAVQLLESSIKQAQDALTDIRRLVYGLRPPALDELGLVGALKQATQQYRQVTITIEVTELPPLPAAVEVATYRIVQEALKNAIEHGEAKHCFVSLSLDGRFNFSVGDDGRGLPEAATPGVGLVSMRERAEELGGAFTIHPRLAGGTEIEVSLPLE